MIPMNTVVRKQVRNKIILKINVKIVGNLLLEKR
jgi:hypothetical protein